MDPLSIMTLPPAFLRKPHDQIRHELAGLPSTVLEATLSLHRDGRFEEVEAMLPGLINYHLPPGTAAIPEPLPPQHRLREDLGLDSLALSELAFKLDEIFAVPIETHEVADVLTVEDLHSFLRAKLELQPEPSSPEPTGAAP